MKFKHLAYLGLGSNLKQPVAQLRRGIKILHHHPDIQLLKSAPWYRSKAWGVTDQPDFINTVVAVSTRLTPHALLKTVKVIEYRLMGRQANDRWHARTIDIDVLLFDQVQMNTKTLVLPHPWIAKRCFVTHPLLQLQPKLPADLKQSMAIEHQNHCCERSLVQLNHRKTTVKTRFGR